jgi:hypothetical protein
VTELGAGEVEEWGDLLAVGGQIAGNVGVGQRRAFVGPHRGVADLGGHVADDEDDLVAHALEAAQDQHRHRVPQVHFGAGWVDAELCDEPPALGASLDHPGGRRVCGGLQLLGSLGDEGGLLGR